MPTFSIITTCKGRLHHLQQTLPLMLKQSDSTCIVVDYNCPQKSGDWVTQHYPQVKVVRVTDDEGWNISRARNFGAQAAETEWLLFTDADILMTADICSWLAPQLAKGKFFRGGIMPQKMDTWGTVACHRDDFAKIGGYDEVLRGWGKEDDDLYYRLRTAGCIQHFAPEALLNPIVHDDAERTLHSPYKNRWVSHAISSLYLQMKYDLTNLYPERCTLQMRHQLYEHARRHTLRISSQMKGADMTVSMQLGNHTGMPTHNPLWKIERTLVYTLFPRQRVPGSRAG